jgi:hypothetical protein
MAVRTTDPLRFLPIRTVWASKIASSAEFVGEIRFG